MPKFLKVFFSMGSMVALIIVFAIASAAATIVESLQGTDAAVAYIYGARWFHAIMLLLVINLVYNFFKF